jgi:imidazole glycerol-phosphate synthase subunit HisH
MKKVTLIDYGAGNIFSVCRAFEACGADIHLTSDPKEIANAERLVLPGVGAFKDSMDGLLSRGLKEPIANFVQTGRPFLGICVGLQLLMEIGEEFGTYEGLGLIPGKTIQIPEKTVEGEILKRPHIGWSQLESANDNQWKTSILKDLTENDLVYFVHSYHSVPTDKKHLLAYTSYGGHNITAALHKDNMTGCQFHPERSGPTGLKILKTFLAQ